MIIRALIVTLLLTAAGPATARAACDPVGSLPQGSGLFHGAPVGMFTWRHPDLNPAPPFAHPREPDGPAWFAATWQFSVHAGVRYLVGRQDTSVFLHRYELKRQVALLVCDDHADFERETRIDTAQGDFEMALEFCRKYVDQYNGYQLQRDAVRGEPEVILCRPAAVLKLLGTQAWPVAQVSEGGGNFTGAIGFDFAGNDWGCVLKNDDLADFSCHRLQNRAARPRRR